MAWKLLHAGFVTLSYDPDGQERFTWNPTANLTAEEAEEVYQTIKAAGPQGMTSQDAADQLGMPLVKVRAIIGDHPWATDTAGTTCWRSGWGSGAGVRPL